VNFVLVQKQHFVLQNETPPGGLNGGIQYFSITGLA